MPLGKFFNLLDKSADGFLPRRGNAFVLSTCSSICRELASRSQVFSNDSVFLRFAPTIPHHHRLFPLSWQTELDCFVLAVKDGRVGRLNA